MTFFRPLSALTLTFLLTACAVTGPADDGWETQQESTNTGSITDGGFVLLDEGGKIKRNRNKETYEERDTGISYDTEAPTDYQSYKQWRQARERDSAEYEKFKQWQEFEEYKRWKESQNR